MNMEIKRGNIFYNKNKNYYAVVTTCVFTDTIRFVCMMFDGYETDHKYMRDKIFTRTELSNEDSFNQVGGIY